MTTVYCYQCGTPLSVFAARPTLCRSCQGLPERLGPVQECGCEWSDGQFWPCANHVEELCRCGKPVHSPDQSRGSGASGAHR